MTLVNHCNRFEQISGQNVHKTHLVLLLCLYLSVGMDPLHLLLQVILVSEGGHLTLGAVACRLPDLHATSIPVAQEGKSILNIIFMLKLCKSQFSALCLHTFKIPNWI